MFFSCIIHCFFLGQRLQDASNTCKNLSQNQEAAGRKKKRCPTVDDIQEKVFEELADALCIFTELGWVDNSYQLNNATVMEDIQSLPVNVCIFVTHSSI